MGTYDNWTREELIETIDQLKSQVALLNKKISETHSSHSDGDNIIEKSNRFLHNPANGYDLLLKTCDTLFLLQRDGTCIDMIVKSNHNMIKEEQIIDQNILNLLPINIREDLKYEFDRVLEKKLVSNKNYEFSINRHTFYFKCIIQSISDDLVLCQYRDITQPLKIMKKLESLNLRLRETGSIAMIGQWTYNQNKEVISYHGNVGGLFEGYNQVSMPIADYYKYIHPDDMPEVRHYMSREEPTTDFIDYRIIIGNRILYFRSKIILVYQKNSNIMIDGYVQNITDFIRDRNELDMLTNAVNKSNDIIFGARADGVFIFANYQCRKSRGIPKDDNISEYSISNRIVQKKYPRNWSDLVDTLKKENIYKYTVEQNSENAQRKGYFDCTSYLIKNDSGEDTIWSFWKNITKQTEAENQIKTGTRLLQTILDNIPAAIFVKDSASGFKNIYINKEACEYPLLKKNVNILNKTDFELFPYELAEVYRNEDKEIIKTKESLRRIKELPAENGLIRTVDELKLMVPKENDDSALIIAIEWDITEMKKIESELIKAKEKAEESDKLKSAFLSNMSHEIRTPLNAIVGFSRIMSEINDETERRKYYDIVESNNVRLLSLINEILDLSRIESGSVQFVYQVFELKSLLIELRNNLSLSFTNNVELILDMPTEDIWLETDRNRLYQVLSNLIMNAYKFTKKGEVRFGAKRQNDRVEFYVRDTGIGIPEDKIATIFNRFVKVDSNAPGTGLGLAICRTIIEKLGGDISVKSTLGKKTEFDFYLPYKQVSIPIREDMQKESVKVKPEQQQKIKILIVENNDDGFLLLKVMLHDNYVLIHTSDYKQVATICKKQKPHIVLVDISDTKSCVASAIHVDNPDIAVIALSSFAYEDDLQKAKACGFTDVLIKPINKDQLVEILNTYI